MQNYLILKIFVFFNYIIVVIKQVCKFLCLLSLNPSCQFYDWEYVNKINYICKILLTKFNYDLHNDVILKHNISSTNIEVELLNCKIYAVIALSYMLEKQSGKVKIPVSDLITIISISDNHNIKCYDKVLYRLYRIIYIYLKNNGSYTPEAASEIMNCLLLVDNLQNIPLYKKEFLYYQVSEILIELFKRKDFLEYFTRQDGIIFIFSS